MRTLTKSLSSLDGQPDGKTVIECDQMTKPKFPESQRAACQEAMNKAFESILNRLISVCPLEASPNQIVLVGWSPAQHGCFP